MNVAMHPFSSININHIGWFVSTSLALHPSTNLVRIGNMGNRIAELREKKGLSQEDLGELSGTSGQQIGRLEKGARKLTTEWMERLAPHLDVRPRDLIGNHHVPLVGYVGAGAIMHYYAFADSPDEFVPMPENANENTVAVEVRGSSLGSIFDTWLVYYDQVQLAPTSDMVGKLCVVGLADDRVLVKRLRRGSAPGRYNLESNTEGLIEDAEIVWAAKVKSMRPR